MRTSALTSAAALRETLVVVDQVLQAVAVAKKDPKRDATLKDTALMAMHKALDATKLSAMAMQMTTEALQHAASEETNELVNVLEQVGTWGWGWGWCILIRCGAGERSAGHYYPMLNHGICCEMLRGAEGITLTHHLHPCTPCRCPLTLRRPRQ